MEEETVQMRVQLKLDDLLVMDAVEMRDNVIQKTKHSPDELVEVNRKVVIYHSPNQRETSEMTSRQLNNEPKRVGKRVSSSRLRWMNISACSMY